MPKISIIVPVYKVEKYLRRCLDSIVAQTLTNWECILVDDGSPDNSGKICDEYAQKDGRFIVLHQENQGVSVARNVGIEKSSGEWIMFVDPDDYLENTMVSTLVQKSKSDDDIVQCCCKRQFNGVFETDYFYAEDMFFDSEDKKYILYCELLSAPEADKRKKKAQHNWIGAPWAKIIKTAFLRKHNILFDPILRCREDVIFNLYAFTIARKIKYINESLYVYNHDHMIGFNAKYNTNTFLYSKLFAKARYDWFEKNIKTLNQEIRDVFIIGSYNVLISILGNGPLHPKYDEQRKTIRKECDKVFNEPYFTFLKKKYKGKIKVGVESKVRQFFIRHKCWYIQKYYKKAIESIFRVYRIFQKK